MDDKYYVALRYVGVAGRLIEPSQHAVYSDVAQAISTGSEQTD